MILLSIKVNEYSELRSLLNGKLNQGEDGVEIRLDMLPKRPVDFGALKNYEGMKLLTLKNEAFDMLSGHPEYGNFFDMFDLDHKAYETIRGKIRDIDAKVMVSIHTSSKSEIRKFMDEFGKSERRLKIVLNDGRLSDFLEIKKSLPLTEEITFFLTGEENKITRIYGINGKGLNYSYQDQKTASGQFSVREALEIKNKDVYGLVGNPLSKSLSKEIYEMIFRKFNINATYQNFEIQKDQLKEFLQIAREVGIKGLNFTIPFKLEASKLLNAKDEPINFIKFGLPDETRNTDLEALIYLTAKLPKEKILIYGNGASAHTAATAFQESERYVIGRNMDKVSEFAKVNGMKILKDKGHFDVLVNATPVGMYSDESIPNIIMESEFGTIVDFPYSFEETAFQKLAKLKGSNYLSGLEILTKQASLNIKYWFGRDIDYSQLLKSLKGGRNEGN